MSALSASMFRLRLGFLIGLMCICLSHCGYPSDDGFPSATQELELPSGELAFVSRCCECDDADTLLLALPSREITPVLLDQQDDYELAWSPNGQMLGVLSWSGFDERLLRIVDISARRICFEWQGSFLQYSWSPDSGSIYYLDREGSLYLYDLMNNESKYITDGVSRFSISPNGQWLGLSKRDLAYSGYFTFRVLDLSDGRLLTVPFHSSLDDAGRLGINRSVWSPTANEVAVLFGASAAQESKVVIRTFPLT